MSNVNLKTNSVMCNVSFEHVYFLYCCLKLKKLKSKFSVAEKCYLLLSLSPTSVYIQTYLNHTEHGCRMREINSLPLDSYHTILMNSLIAISMR